MDRAQRAAKLKSQKKCHYCRKALQGEKKTEDHIVPLSLGGKARSWNTVLACESCNTKKDNKWPSRHCHICIESIDRHAELGITKDTDPSAYIAPSGRTRTRRGRTSYTKKPEPTDQ